MNDSKIKFLIGVGIQIFIIFIFVFLKLINITRGYEVVLKAKPVDPTDIFRGDYLTFKYNISEIEAKLLKDFSLKEGDVVYVPLVKNGDYWDAGYGVSKTMPNDGKIFIKGQVSYISSYDSKMTVVYGIEDYFIPEGKGREIDFFGKEVMAKVSIDGRGNAVLKKIYINGKPWP